jgi:hypothetical protein
MNNMMPYLLKWREYYRLQGGSVGVTSIPKLSYLCRCAMGCICYFFWSDVLWAGFVAISGLMCYGLHLLGEELRGTAHFFMYSLRLMKIF